LALRVVEKAALSDVGRARQGNEDSFLEQSPLFAVADGMGGARAGEVASRIAVETLEGDMPDGSAGAEEQLAAVAKAANRRIYDLAQADASHAGMGTTFTAALVTGNELAVGHVGDSRLYRLRDGELERLTHDHSLVEEFVRQGKLTPEEAEVHPQRSIITRALGPEPDVQVDTFTYPGKAEDVYLACSDGLTGMISEGTVQAILAQRESLEDAAKKLIDAANEGGGRDNITVVLWRLGEDPDADEDSDTLGDEATQGGLSAADVRAAIDEANALDPDGKTRTRARDVPETTEPADIPAVPETTVPRDIPESSGSHHRPEVENEPRRPPPARGGRSRSRRALVVALVILMLAALGVGFYAFARKTFFVGTNDSGLVTLYRGLPYDLPLGLSLYSRQHVSAVPARTLCPTQRKRILDHQLRSKGDATDLVQQVETGRLQQDC
jgi:protein phosphatase